MAKSGIEVEYDNRRLMRMSDVVKRNGRNLINATIHAIAATDQDLINAPGHGRQYGKHQASAPGEPPATDMGELANSVGAEMINDLEGAVYETAEYAAALEVGTSHVAARPHLGPAMEQHRETFQKAAKELFKGV